ncbi:hypothetical protein Dcar01_01324 [Deinococcus carri]|uniref:Uncharacterized protein n=1 Tax=Deinococcus carri TaxID=1211323 RepID=A0ABP9W5H3_9DEIO
MSDYYGFLAKILILCTVLASFWVATTGFTILNTFLLVLLAVITASYYKYYYYHLRKG